jgi:hypothetical protein
MAPPQLAQVQLPSVRGLASVAPMAAKPSSSIGPLEAGASKSAKSGTSLSSCAEAPRAEVSAGAPLNPPPPLPLPPLLAA